MILTPGERETLAEWVAEKFYIVAADDIYGGADIDIWERIDPWIAEHIMDHSEFSRFPGYGSTEGSMVVRVVMVDPFGDPFDEDDEPVSDMWPYSELQRHGYDPLSNSDVADYVATKWEHLFEDEADDAYGMLGRHFWIPRGMADAYANGVPAFARIAGAAGFYVFRVEDKVVLGADYDTMDQIETHWASLYMDLTGRSVGRPG